MNEHLERRQGAYSLPVDVHFLARRQFNGPGLDTLDTDTLRWRLARATHQPHAALTITGAFKRPACHAVTVGILLVRVLMPLHFALLRAGAQTLKILLVPLSQVTMMSPPLGVIGRPVAVSMNAISGLVDSVPVSL